MTPNAKLIIKLYHSTRYYTTHRLHCFISCSTAYLTVFWCHNYVRYELFSSLRGVQYIPRSCPKCITRSARLMIRSLLDVYPWGEAQTQVLCECSHVETGLPPAQHVAWLIQNSFKTAVLYRQIHSLECHEHNNHHDHNQPWKRRPRSDERKKC